MQVVLNAYKAPFSSDAASKSTPAMTAVVWGATGFLVAKLLG